MKYYSPLVTLCIWLLALSGSWALVLGLIWLVMGAETMTVFVILVLCLWAFVTGRVVRSWG